MTILKSFDVKSLLTSSTIQVDSVATYSPTGTYAVDVEVQYEGKVYISMADGNIGNQPDISPLKWDYDRPTNDMALFDEYPSTISKNVGKDIVLEFDSDDMTLMALGSLEGDLLTIELIDKATDEELDKREIPLKEYDEPWDIYDYFFIFGDVENRVHYIGNFTPYFGAKLRITITKDSETNNSAIGFIQFGTSKKLGCTVRDTVRFSDRSGVELQRVNGKLIIRDTIGYSQMTLPVFIQRLQDIYPIRKELSKYRGKPIVILGDDTGENLAYVMIGIYTEIEESITTHGEYTITVNSMDEII